MRQFWGKLWLIPKVYPQLIRNCPHGERSENSHNPHAKECEYLCFSRNSSSTLICVKKTGGIFTLIFLRETLHF